MATRTTISLSLEYSLRLFGAWPNSPYPILISVIWTLVMSTCLVFQCWYCVTHVQSSLIELLDGVCITLSNSLVLLKLIVIWYHRRTFYDILTMVFEDSEKCTSVSEDGRIMTEKATLSSRISNFLIGYYMVTFLIYAVLALELFDEHDVTSVSEQRKLLIRMEFPFDATVSPRYEIIVALQFIFQAFSTHGAAISIALIAVLTLHVGSQIDLLCEKMAKTFRTNEKNDFRTVVLTDVVVSHQRIIRFCRNVETIFTYISLYQFVSNMLVICFVSFILVTGTALVIKCFPYYVAINCEAFVLCYTGEYLTSKSESISQSVYNFLWYDLKPAEGRDVLFIILRSQSQLILTAGKFVNLSLEAFANMLKASASYVSVLYAIY